MKAMYCIAIAAALTLVGCGEKKDKANGSQTNAVSSGGSPLTAPVDYLGATLKAQQKAISVTDTASLNQAIQMFNVDQGRNPKDLNELVEMKVIGKIPDAPYGFRLDYNPASGKVKVVPK